jgi:hypothetical protein
MTEATIARPFGYAEMAAELGVTEDWLRHNIGRYRRHKRGNRVVFTDADREWNREQADAVRPEPSSPDISSLIPSRARRRRRPDMTTAALNHQDGRADQSRKE